MREFIIISIIGIFTTWFISALNIFHLKRDSSQTEASAPYELLRVVTTNPGTIGCLTQDYFEKITQYSAKKNYEEMKKIIDQGLCVYFAKGTELLLQKNICNEGDKNGKIFSAMPRGMNSIFFMTCSVIR